MPSANALAEYIRAILEYIGEDPDREGLIETPDRMIRSWGEIFSGYRKDPAEVFKVFDAPYDNIVLKRNIEMYSVCEHHFLPFFGKAHIAYIPDGNRVIGASKLVRLLEVYSNRLQIQERIGEQVTSDLMEYLRPKGAACIIEATHLCMRMRGVRNQNSEMVTSSLKGVFLNKTDARLELMHLIYR